MQGNAISHCYKVAVVTSLNVVPGSAFPVRSISGICWNWSRRGCCARGKWRQRRRCYIHLTGVGHTDRCVVHLIEIMTTCVNDLWFLADYLYARLAEHCHLPGSRLSVVRSLFCLMLPCCRKCQLVLLYILCKCSGCTICHWWEIHCSKPQGCCRIVATPSQYYCS